MRFTRGRHGLRSRLMACTVGAAMVLSLVPAPALAEAVEELAPAEAGQKADEAPDTAVDATDDQETNDTGDAEGLGDDEVVDRNADVLVLSGDSAGLSESSPSASGDADNAVSRDAKGATSPVEGNVALRAQGDDITTWSGLQQAISDAPRGTHTTIKLACDLTLYGEDAALEVDEGKIITLDLAGHTIDRNIRSTSDKAINNRGTLTITGDGTISGGEQVLVESSGIPHRGGGIFNDVTANLTIDGCTIKNLDADLGGAIYNSGVLTIKEGLLVSNLVSGDGGGGVFNDSEGTFYLHGGSIYNNITYDCSGGGVYNKGTLIMDGGTVKNNEIHRAGDKKYGAGVYNEGTFEMSGGDISDNWVDYCNAKGAGVANAGTMTVTGGTIARNNSHATLPLNQKSVGGGFLNLANGVATLKDCTISDNHALAYAGGVCVEGGEVTLERVEITGNSCDGVNGSSIGAGIYISGGSLTMTEVTVSGNTANGNSYGGGIYVCENGELTLRDSTVTDNTCKNDGGGIYYKGGNLKLAGSSKVVGNTSTDAAGQNLYLDGETLIGFADALTEDADVHFCISGDGRVFTSGYSDLHGDADPSTYFATDGHYQIAKELDDGEAYCIINPFTWAELGSFLSNMNAANELVLQRDLTATGDDSPLVVPEGRTVTINLNGHTLNRGLAEAQADENGGAIINNGTLTMSNGTVTGGNTSAGGGILNNGTLSLDNVTIANNKAANGGGIANEGSVTLRDVQLTANVAQYDGGGILNDGEIRYEGQLRVWRNRAERNGGGIAFMGLSDENDLTLGSGVSINENLAQAGSGGGIYMAGESLTLGDGISLASNHAALKGGGLYVGEDSSVWTSGTVSLSWNTADEAGGGAYVSGELRARNGSGVTLNGNGAPKGAGVCVEGDASKAVFNGGSFQGNSSESKGGGLYVGGGDITVSGVSFADNTATQNGGAICHEGGTLKLYGDTDIHGNTSNSAGGGVYHSGGILKVGDSLKVTGNSSDSGEGNLYLTEGETINVGRGLNDDAKIGVYLEPGIGIVTTDYAEMHGDTDPNTYFSADGNYDVFLRDDEVYFYKAGAANSWRELQQAIDAAHDGATISLGRDVMAIQNVDDRLSIPAGKTITIDLKGHRIDRDLLEAAFATAGGSVFYVPVGSSLTLKDSGATKGAITGGNATQGGGIYSEGTLVLDGAIVSGNCAENGGGIYAAGEVTISSGVVSDNTALTNGGGICVEGATATVTGGRIEDNEATIGGGILVVDSPDDDPAELRIEGAPYILGNTASREGNNVRLCGDIKATVTGAFTESAKVGVSIATTSGEGIITSGYGNHNAGVDPSGIFIGESSSLWAYLTSDGDEAEFGQATTYPVKIDDAAQGEVSVDRQWVPRGGTVTVYESIDGAWPYFTYSDLRGTLPTEKKDGEDRTFSFVLFDIPTDEAVVVYQTYEVAAHASECVENLEMYAPHFTSERDTAVVHQLPGKTVNVSFDLEEEATFVELSYTYNEGGQKVTKILEPTFDGQRANASFTMPGGNVSLMVSACKMDGPVHYVDAHGSDRTCEEYTIVDSTTTEWENGKWYVVGADVTLDQNVKATGGVNLILCDGATLTAQDGISAHKYRDSGRLTIWCQEGGTGALVASSRNEDQPGIGSGGVTRAGSDIVVNGGRITAAGGNYAAGIGGRTSDDGRVTIHGGTVTATGGMGAPGIGQEDAAVTIDGGHVNATGGQGAPGVKCATTTLSYVGDDADMSVYASGYEGIVSFEKEFKAAEDGERYAASTTSEDYDSLAGKTLIPGASYTVTVKETEGGTVTASREVAAAGNEVTLTAEPDEGFELRRLSVKDASGNEVELGDDGTFEMPASDVTVEATFRGEGTPDFDAIEYYMSIALKDSIDVNLYVQKLPEGTEPGDYTVRYRVGDGEERVATLTSMTSNYVNLAALTARQMSEPVRVEVYHVSQDEPIKVVEDCGIRRYCDDKLDNPDTPEKLGALCQAALDYGTMAQVHFKYLTDDLANANHGEGTEAAIAATTVPREYAASGEAPSAEFSQRVASVSGSVSLESRVTVNLYVEPAAGTTAEDIAVTVGGVEAGTTDAVSRRTLDDGRVLVQVTGISARNLDKRLEVEVSAGGASRTIGYSPLSYAYSKQGVAKDRLGDTCKALYNYWKAASEYLG